MDLNKQKESFLQHLKLSLRHAQIKSSEKDFLFKGLKHASVLCFSFLIVFFLFFDDFFLSIILSLAVFCLGFIVWLNYPLMRKKKISMQIEKHLPFFLMSLSVQLKVGVPLLKALKNTCSKEKNVLGKELLSSLRQVEEGGASLQDSLLALSERIDSFMFKRALAQIISVYEQGTKNVESLTTLAKEQLAVQKTQSKEFSGKLALYSLFFIAVSTIIPALFLSIILVGSSFLEIGFSATQILLIVCVGFPLVDLLVLFFVKAMTPEFLK